MGDRQGWGRALYPSGEPSNRCCHFDMRWPGACIDIPVGRAAGGARRTAGSKVYADALGGAFTRLFHSVMPLIVFTRWVCGQSSSARMSAGDAVASVTRIQPASTSSNNVRQRAPLGSCSANVRIAENAGTCAVIARPRPPSSAT